jgi:putative oxidoreductase
MANSSLQGVAGRWSAFAPQLLSVLRMMTAFMFILHGTSKLFAFPAALLPNGATAVFPTQIWFAGVLEVFGGALLFLGLFTRPVAFLLSGEMAVAYFQFHFPRGFWPTLNNGVAPVLYCFIWLYISAAGAGPWSLDALRRR